MRRKPNQCALHFHEQITRAHFFLLLSSIRPVPAQVILLWKGPPKLCIECHLVPMRAFPPKLPGWSFVKPKGSCYLASNIKMSALTDINVTAEVRGIPTLTSTINDASWLIFLVFKGAFILKYSLDFYVTKIRLFELQIYKKNMFALN